MTEDKFWSIFACLITILLVLDLGYLQRRPKILSFKETLLLSGFWITAAFGFNLFIYFSKGSTSALEFFTGFIVEKSLSMDNLFVFFALFASFKVPKEYQHRVLSWGIFGALILRLILIFCGASLLQTFHWMTYILGGVLLMSGCKLLFQKHRQIPSQEHFIVRFFHRYVPLTKEFRDGHFFIREGKKIKATPLFLVLIVIEMTDLIFAIDSIPAIFGITSDLFIVYTSNIFAILGLRSLYFLLIKGIALFRYLNVGIAAILIFIGFKFLADTWIVIPLEVTLVIIGGMLSLPILISLMKTVKKN